MLNCCYISSLESQKGVIAVQRCSVENQKALSPHKLYSDSALLVLNGTSLIFNYALLAHNWRYIGFAYDKVYVLKHTQRRTAELHHDLCKERISKSRIKLIYFASTQPSYTGQDLRGINNTDRPAFFHIRYLMKMSHFIILHVWNWGTSIKWIWSNNIQISALFRSVLFSPSEWIMVNLTGDNSFYAQHERMYQFQ